MSTNQKSNTPTGIRGHAGALNEENPFKVSGRITRSPVGVQTQPQFGQTLPETPNHTPVDVEDVAAFVKLGGYIKDLVAMLQENDGKRRHINQQMRDTIDGIKTMYEKCRLDKDATRTSRKETKDKSLQTSPRTYAQKVMERSGGVTPLQYASGEKRTQPEASKRKQPGDADTPTAKRRNVASTGAAEQHTASAPNGQRPSKDLEWQKVRAKMKKKRKADRLKERPAKGRPDAIVIAAKGELSYADMLRKVKDEPQLSKFGEAVQKIRRTQKGELLLQLNQSGEKAEELRAAVG
ncbi:uncharacterized protein ACN2A1_013694 isoform 2-T3 [Glossina fuscipes fuscipes]